MIDSLLDNWNCFGISWADSAGNLSWLFRLSRLTVLHAAHILNRHRVDNLLYCFLRLFRGSEGKLLYDLDSE